MTGQKITHCCKWRLTTTLFDLITNGKVDIIVFGAETSTKRAEISCATLTAFKNPINYFENSQGKDFAKPDNGQKCLID